VYHQPCFDINENHIAGCKSGDSCKKCPYWIEGRHQGRRWHQSLKTTDAKTAAQLIQRVILTGKLEIAAEAGQRITLAGAITKFFTEITSRGSEGCGSLQMLSYHPGVRGLYSGQPPK
jgi:hypothetical protein